MNVDSLLYAHDTIRSHIRLVLKLMPADKSEYKVDSPEVAAVNSFEPDRLDLEKIIYNLAEGLNRHLAFEEEVLPGLIGEILMEFILMEHRKISRGIDEITSLFRDTGFHNALVWNQDRRKRVKNFMDYLLEHCETEDIILKLFRRNYAEMSAV